MNPITPPATSDPFAPSAATGPGTMNPVLPSGTVAQGEQSPTAPGAVTGNPSNTAGAVDPVIPGGTSTPGEVDDLVPNVPPPPAPSGAVRYTPQNLTDEEKAQARANVGAISADEVPAQNNLTASKAVANQAARLALALVDAQGFAIIDADSGKTWMLTDGSIDPSIEGSWLQLGDRNIVAGDVVGLSELVASRVHSFASKPDGSAITKVGILLTSGMFPPALWGDVLVLFPDAILIVDLFLDSAGGPGIWAGMLDSAVGDVYANIAVGIGVDSASFTINISNNASFATGSASWYFSGDVVITDGVSLSFGGMGSANDGVDDIPWEIADNVVISLVSAQAQYAGNAGEFAVYDNDGVKEIAYCSVGGLSPVWHAVDSDWMVARLGLGAIAINQVNQLRSELDARWLKTDEIDAHGLVSRSPDGARWRVNISNSGVISSTALTDALVTAYFDATGISSSNASKLQTFVSALSSAGVLAAMIDGGILKSAYSKIQNGVIRSLRGQSNLTLIGDPVLGDCGLILNGQNQAAHASFLTPPTSRTFFCLSSYGQAFQTPWSTAAFGWVLKNSYPYNTYAGEYLRFLESSTGALFATMADGGASEKLTTNADGVSRSFPPKSYFSAYTYDGTVAQYTANAVTFRNFGGTKVYGKSSKLTSSVTNLPHAPQNLFIGASGNGTPSTNYCEMAAGNWMLFNRVLSDAEIANVYAAFNVIQPRWKYVPAGDSLEQFTTPRLMKLPELYGTNCEVVNIAAGGTTVPSAVAALGTTGFTTARLAGTNVVADFINTDDISPSYTVAQYHADLRTIWSFIRTSNPAAKIIGQTISSCTGFETAGKLADLDSLNALIRADHGAYYDVLVDTWQICEDLKNPTITYHHNDPAVIVDGVHFSEVAAQAIARAKVTAIESTGIVIR